jgi:O-succinylbenzoic acid--CoA ligase
VEGEALPATLEKRLLALLGERLGRYELPKAVVYIPTFKATASGKLDRAASLRCADAPRRER